jgi:hypothetical protein
VIPVTPEHAPREAASRGSGLLFSAWIALCDANEHRRMGLIAARIAPDFEQVDGLDQ